MSGAASRVFGGFRAPDACAICHSSEVPLQPVRPNAPALMCQECVRWAVSAWAVAFGCPPDGEGEPQTFERIDVDSLPQLLPPQGCA